MFLADLTKLLKFPYSVYFIEASSYHGQGQSKVKIVNEIEPQKFEGKVVVLLDELFDTGVTMETIRNHLISKVGVKTVYTCALYSKKTPNQRKLPDIIGYVDLPSVWLVGYGLDDNSEKRGWTWLYGIPKEQGMKLTPDDEIFNDPSYYSKIRQEILLSLNQG